MSKNVREIQTKLDELGYRVGTIDGVPGPLYRSAVEQFQLKEGLTVDGIVGQATRAKLFGAEAESGIVDPQDLFQWFLGHGVSYIHTMGILANMRAESRFDAGVQEKRPIAGRGGYGLCQWTGPRRRNLEAFAKTQGKQVWDWEMQLEFLMTEPDTDRYLKTTFDSAEEATDWFLRHWERPAVPNTSTRLRYLAALQAELHAPDESIIA